MQSGGSLLRRAMQLRALTRSCMVPTPTATTAARAETAVVRRRLHASAMAGHGYSTKDLDPATAVSVVYVGRDGEEIKVLAPEGKNLLEIAHANEIDLEGACEGSLACRYVGQAPIPAAVRRFTSRSGSGALS